MSASDSRAEPPEQIGPRRRWGPLPTVVTGAVSALAWWLAAQAADALPSPSPSPGTTATELWDMAADGRLGSILWRMAAFMGACFAIAVVLGVAGGLAIGMSRSVDRGLSPYLAALQGMPTSMWIPVAAIVLGTRTAVRNVPPLHLRAGRTLGESGTSLVRRVVLPAALPGIMSGVELSCSIAFRCLVAGEIFSGALSGTGIGEVIGRSRKTGDLTEMMATIVVVLTFTVAVDRLVFSRVQSRLRTRRGRVDVGLPH
ncbi:ABC transporter permease subunit [Demequina sp.]|uniref:ABC transporter permease n=1 Tax=Demequina sp. TaxID=2050685 RepID=UPI0025BB90D7|nr:ABC transporter permease subunit [Demequina sp.]